MSTASKHRRLHPLRHRLHRPPTRLPTAIPFRLNAPSAANMRTAVTRRPPTITASVRRLCARQRAQSTSTVLRNTTSMRPPTVTSSRLSATLASHTHTARLSLAYGSMTAVTELRLHSTARIAAPRQHTADRVAYHTRSACYRLPRLHCHRHRHLQMCLRLRLRLRLRPVSQGPPPRRLGLQLLRLHHPRYHLHRRHRPTGAPFQSHSTSNILQ